MALQTVEVFCSDMTSVSRILTTDQRPQ